MRQKSTLLEYEAKREWSNQGMGINLLRKLFKFKLLKRKLEPLEKVKENEIFK